LLFYIEEVFNILSTSQKKEIAIKASIFYYEKNKSQSYIAKELGISRSYVSLLLNYARNQGIVKITIDVDTFKLRMIRKEIELKSLFPKVKQIYIMKSTSSEFTKRNIGIFSAPYVTDLLKNSNVIGVGLGRSVSKVINSLKKEDFSDSQVNAIVQIMGGLNGAVEAGTHSNELVKKLSEKMNCNCKYYYLHYPAIFENANLKDILINEQSIKPTIDMWNKIDLAIMGIGVVDKKSTLFKLFTEDMVEKVRNSQAVGQINTNFFDLDGQDVPMLENNKICIPVEKMKRIQRKIVIGFEKYKAEALYGALKGDYIDILFTDSITIKALEEYMRERKRRVNPNVVRKNSRILSI